MTICFRYVLTRLDGAERLIVTDDITSDVRVRHISKEYEICPGMAGNSEPR